MDTALPSSGDPPPLRAIRLWLFDIDGTLLRTGGAGLRAFSRVAAMMGYPGATNDMVFHGRTDSSLASEFLRKVGLADSERARSAFLDAYAFFLDDELSQSRGELCPGVFGLLDTLRALEDRPVLGLLTGNIRLGAALKLAAHGIEESFVCGAFGDDHEDRNFLAQVARQRAQRFTGDQLRGEEIVVVGDTPADIACSRAIEARSLAVATGAYSAEELWLHRPWRVVQSLAEVGLEGVDFLTGSDRRF